MQQVVGDLWRCEADWLCITTNGVTRGDGLAVMGAGCADQAVQKVAGIQQRLGTLLQTAGNHVHFLGFYDQKRVYSFPTKHHWRDPSTLDLIERSAFELHRLWADWQTVFDETPQVVIPRPGCGAGKLTWKQVKPRLLKSLKPDAFKIIAFREGDFR